MGYRGDLHRGMGFWSQLSLSLNVLGVLPSVAVFGVGVAYAGSVGLTWGWIVGIIFVFPVLLSIAELSSSLPTCGGLYYASAALAPKGWAGFVSWISGWTSFAGWTAAGPSIDFAMASLITSELAAYISGYTLKVWHTYVIFLAIITSHFIIACSPSRVLGRTNIIGAFFSLGAIATFLVAVTASLRKRSQYQSDITTWTKTTEGGSPNAVAFLQSIILATYTFSGMAAPLHLSEECVNAALVGPQAMVRGAQVTATTGFLLLLTMAYTVRSIPAPLTTPNAILTAYLTPVLGSGGALAMFILVIISAYFVGIGCFASASRVVFSLARDGILPFGGVWRKLNPRTHTPVNAVLLCWAIGTLTGLLAFASPLATTALFSVTGLAQYVAFFIPLSLKLFSGKFKQGPWNLGRWSKPLNVVALIFILGMMPILCLPATRGSHLNAQGQNYSAVAYAGFMLLVSLWYLVFARKFFLGPRAHLLNSPEIDPEVHKTELRIQRMVDSMVRIDLGDPVHATYSAYKENSERLSAQPPFQSAFRRSPNPPTYTDPASRESFGSDHKSEVSTQTTRNSPPASPVRNSMSSSARSLAAPSVHNSFVSIQHTLSSVTVPGPASMPPSPSPPTSSSGSAKPSPQPSPEPDPFTSPNPSPSFFAISPSSSEAASPSPSESEFPFVSPKPSAPASESPSPSPPLSAHQPNSSSPSPSFSPSPSVSPKLSSPSISPEPSSPSPSPRPSLDVASRSLIDSPKPFPEA